MNREKRIKELEISIEKHKQKISEFEDKIKEWKEGVELGITIDSKRHSYDMGYRGFCRFRNIVAEKVNEEFYKHYLELSNPEAMFLFGSQREEYFKKYDAKTKEFVEQDIVTIGVANFYIRVIVMEK